jgi:hypothetical protein
MRLAPFMRPEGARKLSPGLNGAKIRAVWDVFCPCGACPGGTDDSSPAIYRRGPRLHGLRPGGTPEFGARGGNFYLEPIRHAGFVATQNQLQASLRDADLIDGQPGDKSPGYYRLSLWDEGKTGFQMSKVQSPAGQ